MGAIGNLFSGGLLSLGSRNKDKIGRSLGTGGLSGILGGDDNLPSFDPYNVARPEDLLDESGNLKEKYKLSGGEGYTKLAQARLAQDISKAYDKAQLQQKSATGNALSNLAMRGGVGSGQRLALQRQGATDLLNAQQGVQQQNIQGQQGIGEKQFDIGREAERFNLSTLIGDRDRKMQEWAAAQSANAQLQNANKPKSGLIGGAVQGLGGMFGKG